MYSSNFYPKTKCSCVQYTCQSAFTTSPPYVKPPAQIKVPKKIPCCHCDKKDCASKLVDAQQKIYPKYFSKIQALKKKIADNNRRMQEVVTKHQNTKQDLFRELSRCLEDYEDQMKRGMQQPVATTQPVLDGICHCKCKK